MILSFLQFWKEDRRQFISLPDGGTRFTDRSLKTGYDILKWKYSGGTSFYTTRGRVDVRGNVILDLWVDIDLWDYTWEGKWTEEREANTFRLESGALSDMLSEKIWDSIGEPTVIFSGSGLHIYLGRACRTLEGFKALLEVIGRYFIVSESEQSPARLIRLLGSLWEKREPFRAGFVIEKFDDLVVAELVRRAEENVHNRSFGRVRYAEDFVEDVCGLHGRTLRVDEILYGSGEGVALPDDISRLPVNFLPKDVFQVLERHELPPCVRAVVYGEGIERNPRFNYVAGLSMLFFHMGYANYWEKAIEWAKKHWKRFCDRSCFTGGRREWRNGKTTIYRWSNCWISAARYSPSCPYNGGSRFGITEFCDFEECRPLATSPLVELRLRYEQKKRMGTILRR